MRVSRKSLDRRLWKLENPPKYKYGDRVNYSYYDAAGDSIVRDVRVDEGHHSFGDVYGWLYVVDDGERLYYNVPEAALFDIENKTV